MIETKGDDLFLQTVADQQAAAAVTACLLWVS